MPAVTTKKKPKSATYGDAFCGPHKEGSYYLLVFTCAEERGGTSKPTGLMVADKLEDLPVEKLNDYTLYEVRNGALFEIHVDEENPPNGNKAKYVVKKTWNPDAHNWYAVWEGEEETVDEDEEIQKGFVLISSSWKDDGTLGKRQVALTRSWATAFGNMVCDEREQLDVYRLEDGEARLVASTAPIPTNVEIDSTGFSQYDRAINPYKACAFKCAYCYAGVFKDFAQLPEKLEGRLVIGTHVDPYQPAEETQKKTQAILKGLIGNKKVSKVGIFTKSPLVTRDIELLKQLPDPHVHINLSPFDEENRKKLEEGTFSNAERLKAIKPLKEAGIKVVLNVCPCIPGISEKAIEEPELVEAYELVDEICIGLLCLYGNIPDKMEELLPAKSVELLRSREWEREFIKTCRKVLRKQMDKKLIIWRDRTRVGWKRLSDLSPLPQEFYAQGKSVVQLEQERNTKSCFKEKWFTDEEIKQYAVQAGGKLEESMKAHKIVRPDGKRLVFQPKDYSYSKIGGFPAVLLVEEKKEEGTYLTTREEIKLALEGLKKVEVPKGRTVFGLGNNCYFIEEENLTPKVRALLDETVQLQKEAASVARKFPESFQIWSDDIRVENEWDEDSKRITSVDLEKKLLRAKDNMYTLRVHGRGSVAVKKLDFETAQKLLLGELRLQIDKPKDLSSREALKAVQFVPGEPFRKRLGPVVSNAEFGKMLSEVLGIPFYLDEKEDRKGARIYTYGDNTLNIHPPKATSLQMHFDTAEVSADYELDTEGRVVVFAKKEREFDLLKKENVKPLLDFVVAEYRRIAK